MAKGKKLQPLQHQARQPGREYKMRPRPKAEDEKQRGSGKLQNKIALITGGDSGIGRAVAIAFAKEGATVAGSDVPLGRAGQPEEIAPSYVFLASDDASYMTGQILHPNGGMIVNG
jgi:NAD(P)-dependent dehydrogenase (short-subunit alcohol dehydrogenase family)